MKRKFVRCWPEKNSHTPRKNVVQPEPPKVNLLVDIQAKLQAGKGAGYARWAKVFNLGGYSKKFREEHEEEILLHQAAKNAFDEMGVKKMPKVKELQTEYAKLLERKEKDLCRVSAFP